MLQVVWDYRLDLVAFTLIAMALPCWVRRYFGGLGGTHRTSMASWCILMLLIATGGFLAEWAGVAERDRLSQLVSGLAPTYAQELQKAGHAQVQLDTDPNDPQYLSLIERQMRWLRVNPAVSDIYTFRQLPDQSIVLIVDSETDYDRNGQFTGDEEKRTAIGEAYDEVTDLMLQASLGVPQFDHNPVTDRWGTWVSAYYPLYRPDGTIDAVLGVDYAAADWLTQILFMRAAVLGGTMFVLLIFVSSSAAVGWHQRELSERTRHQHLLQTKTDELSHYAAALERNNGELRTIRIELEQAALAKSQFLANMSHEIRTPLNGVVGALELLADTALDTTQARFARTARISADCLLSLIDDILDFSKIEAGKLELDPVDFNLRALLEDIGDMFATRVEKKNIELCLDLPPDLPSLVRGDAGRLRQVLINLVTNAIKFTEKGQVVVRAGQVKHASETGCRLSFAVQDTGIGIPPERLDRLFKSFSQVDASTTRKYGGTGLGLALSKELVGLFGGEMGVDSTPGQGSTFWFTLCLDHSEGVTVERDVPAELRGRRVLVVDDNPTNREILQANLQAWGLDCELADSAAMACRMLSKARRSERPFELSIVDMQMPETDGLQLITRLRQDVDYRSLKLMLLTSLSNSLTKPEMSQLGLTCYLTKPVRQARLLAAIIESLSPANHIESVDARPTPNAFAGAVRNLTCQILLADDNEVNQFVTLELLRRAGLRAEAVGNGKEACDAVRSGRFDLVLMDCQMPIMDGFAATATIRREEAMDTGRRRLPIIALTANAVKGDRENCLACGMDDYVTKPINPQELFAAIGRLCPANSTQPIAADTPATRDCGSPTDVAAGPTVLVETPTAEAAEVFDFDQLLNNCFHEADIAQQILEMFPKSVTSHFADLQQALLCQSQRDAVRAAHTIKGLAANVAAQRLKTVAASLERLAKQDDLPAVAAEIAELQQELDRCLNHVPDAIERVARLGGGRDASEVAHLA